MTINLVLQATFLVVTCSAFALWQLHSTRNDADTSVGHVAMRALKIADTVNAVKWNNKVNFTVTQETIAKIIEPLSNCNTKDCVERACNSTDNQNKTSCEEVGQQRAYYAPSTAANNSQQLAAQMQQYAWSVEYHLAGTQNSTVPSIALILQAQYLAVGNSATQWTWGRADANDKIKKCEPAYRSKTGNNKDCTLYQAMETTNYAPIYVSLQDLKELENALPDERELRCTSFCSAFHGLEHAAELERSCKLLLPVCNVDAIPESANGAIPEEIGLTSACWDKLGTDGVFHAHATDIVMYLWVSLLVPAAILWIIALAIMVYFKANGEDEKGVQTVSKEYQCGKSALIISVIVVAVISVLSCSAVVAIGGNYAHRHNKMFLLNAQKPSGAGSGIDWKENCFGQLTARTMGYTNLEGNWITIQPPWATSMIDKGALKQWDDQTTYTTHVVLRGSKRMGHHQIMRPGPKIYAIWASMGLSIFVLVVYCATLFVLYNNRQQ